MNAANLLLFKRHARGQLTVPSYTASVVQDKDQDKQKYEAVIE